MGKVSDEWEFWRPFVFGAAALALLALVTMQMLSSYRNKQQDIMRVELRSGTESTATRQAPDLDTKVAEARSQALASLETNP